jgi:hypothetical protein
MIVTADEQCLRAVDWEDHEPRMQRLLRRHYGTNAILREVSRRIRAIAAVRSPMVRSGVPPARFHDDAYFA